MIKEHISQSNQWILISITLFIFILVYRSPVSHTDLDPRSSLLLSQTIIENKSIKMDAYKDAHAAIYKKDGHYYYFFPIGTSISSIPFVWFDVNILNKHMNNRADDKDTQKFIAAIVSVLIFILLYLIGRLYLNDRLSISISLIFWLGTSLSSTLGQALWSQDFSSLYALLSIFLMLKITKENKNRYWIFLGITLFMAYLTRPTMSLLSVTVVLYLFFNNKRYISIKTAGLFGLMLCIFVLLSLHEFNQLLPDYYLPKRLSTETFWTAFYGNLFSPARGLFIFSPMLFLFLINAKYTYKMFKEDITLIILSFWILFHLIVISKFPHWWGGGSYGPRFMIDILPAIFLLFVILISYSYDNKSFLSKKFTSFFLLITVSMSIYFNAVQGLYNQYAGSRWNASPNIDKYPEYLFDWKYPQFLHTKERHNYRNLEHAMKLIKPITVNQSVAFNSDMIAYIKWSHPESTHRWSLDNYSIIKFRMKEVKKMKGILNLHISTLGKQEIKLIINNSKINSKIVNGTNLNITFKFNPNILYSNSINTIKFEFPNAHKPNNGDQRVLAMALKSFSIE